MMAVKSLPTLYVFDQLSGKEYMYHNTSQAHDLPPNNPKIIHRIENRNEGMNIVLTICGPGYSGQRFD